MMSAGRFRLPGSSLCVWGSRSTSQTSPRFIKAVGQRVLDRLVEGEVVGGQLAAELRDTFGRHALVLLAHGLADVVRTPQAHDVGRRARLLGEISGDSEGKSGALHGLLDA